MKMQAHEDAGAPGVRSVGVDRPLHWLASGWRDLRVVGWPSALHGLIVAAGGLAIVGLTLGFLPLLPGAVSGFVLVGPILATGLYELSRVLQEGGRPSLGHALAAWRRGTRPLVGLGLLLLAAATAWVFLTGLLFAVFVRDAVDSPSAFLRYVLVSQGQWLFLLWLLLGGLGAALVFALTAVSVPLLLDRDVSLRTALLASARAVGDNPVAMCLWATLIMFATALCLASALLGFVVAIPVIGHATWHAYREVLDVESLPRRR